MRVGGSVVAAVVATAAAIASIAVAAVADGREEAAAGAGAASPAAASVRWERLFSADGAPALHAKARYRDAGGNEHRLELWRTARALRRDTDARLSLIVERRAGGADEYHVVQRAGGDADGGPGRAYDVSRDQLNRMGSFPEWTQLATLLTRPRGEVTVTAHEEAKTAAGSCRWYEATAERTRERICWSRALRLPLAVERWEATGPAGGGWVAVVTVDEAKTGGVATALFHPRVDVARVDVRPGARVSSTSPLPSSLSSSSVLLL